MYLYEVTVNTGSRRRAGTASNVYFNLSGKFDSEIKPEPLDGDTEELLPS